MYQVTLTAMIEAESPADAAAEFRMWIGDNYPLSVTVRDEDNAESEEEM